LALLTGYIYGCTVIVILLTDLLLNLIFVIFELKHDNEKINKIEQCFGRYRQSQIFTHLPNTKYADAQRLTAHY